MCMAVTKYIVFRLNDQKYSMKLTKINGIEYVYHVVPVPMGLHASRELFILEMK